MQIKNNLKKETEEVGKLITTSSNSKFCNYHQPREDTGHKNLFQEITH